jgi:hypothetical protein
MPHESGERPLVGVRGSTLRVEIIATDQKGTFIVAMMLLLGMPPTTLWPPTNAPVALPKSRISALGSIGSTVMGGIEVKRSVVRSLPHTTISPAEVSPHWRSAGPTRARSKAIGGVDGSTCNISQLMSMRRSTWFSVDRRIG